MLHFTANNTLVALSWQIKGQKHRLVLPTLFDWQVSFFEVMSTYQQQKTVKQLRRPKIIQ